MRDHSLSSTMRGSATISFWNNCMSVLTIQGGRRVRLYSGRGYYDWKKRIAVLSEDLQGIPAHSAVVGAELCVPGRDGAPGFFRLLKVDGRRAARIRQLVPNSKFYVSSATFCDGIDEHIAEVQSSFADGDAGIFPGPNTNMERYR
jgi:hypothetical protein